MIPDALKDNALAAAVEARQADALVDGHNEHGEATLEIAPASIVGVCRMLKAEYGFNRLSGSTAVDWTPRAPRFDVVYHLHATGDNQRVRLKCKVGEDEEIDSVFSVWRAADWYEREMFDMFGIRFRNHPNLRRLLMPEDWEGYPLRKDYPVHGYKYSYQDE